ncbi:MAG: hypothetical protein KGO92_15145 [Bacteroidota bacterium]|nr:hypothetical protein [Bacteroidota bacterium]
MRRYRFISLILLFISSFIGIVRGFRMIWYKEGNNLIRLYPMEIIRNSIFSNYTVYGWILFFLVGIFSIIAFVCTLSNIRNYGYFIIVEGIFALFFTSINMAYTTFGPVHAILLPICFLIILLGIVQTPREF